LAEELYRSEIVIDVNDEDAIRRIQRAESRINQFFNRIEKRNDTLSKLKIEPLLSVRDKLTDKVLKADQLIKRLDVAQASPLIEAQDRVSSVITRINASLKALEQGKHEVAVDLKGNVIDQINKAKKALSALDDVKTGPVAELKGELFTQLTKAMAEVKKLNYEEAHPRATLKDYVTQGVQKTTETLKNFASKTWNVTIRAKDEVSNTINNLKNKLTSIPGVLGLSLAGAGAATATAYPLKLAGEMEQSQLSIDFFTGGGAKAQKFQDDLIQFAAKTPFELPFLRQQSTGLMGMYKGLYENDVDRSTNMTFRTLRAFGDAAGYTGAGQTGMDFALLGFRQIGTIGKLNLEELRQVTENLLIPMEMVRKELGLTKEEMQKIGELNIPAEKAMEAILRALEKNFGGGMEKMSHSLLGLWSTVKDTARLTVTAFGAGMADPIKRILEDIVGSTDYTSEEFQAFLKKMERAGKVVGEAFENSYFKVKQFFKDIFADEDFRKLDFGDKVVFIIDRAMDELDQWVSGEGGKKVEQIFVKLAEIGTKAWLSAIGGMAKGSIDALKEGNFLGAAGLAFGASVLGGGLLVKGALGAGKAVIGAGKGIWKAAGKVDEKIGVTKAIQKKAVPYLLAGRLMFGKDLYDNGPGLLSRIGSGAKNILGRAITPVIAAKGLYDAFHAKPEERYEAIGNATGTIAGGWAGAKVGAAAGAAIGSVIPGAGTAIGAGVGGVIGGIAGSIGGGALGEKLGSFFKGIDFSGLFDQAKEKASEFKDTVVDAFGQIRDGIAERISSIGESISSGFSSAYQAATEWVSSTVNDVVNWFNSLPEQIGFAVGYSLEWLSQLPGRAAEIFGEMYNNVSLWVSQTVADIGLWFSTLPERVSEWWNQTRTNIAIHAQQMWNDAVTWTIQTVEGVVLWFSTLPQRVGEWWAQTQASVALWAQQTWSAAIQWVTQTVNDITVWWGNLPENINSWWSSIHSTINSWAERAYDSVASWFGSIPTAIENAINGALKWLEDRLEDLRTLRDKFLSGFEKGREAARSDSSRSTRANESNRVAGPQRYAIGGFISSPHLGLVGEAGPEVIIPLSKEKRSRALELFNKTAEFLGIPMFANGGFVPSYARYAGYDSFSYIEPSPAPVVSEGSISVKAAGSGVNVQIGTVNVEIQQGQEIDYELLAQECGWVMVNEIKKAIENSAD
jgi:tape measure domain-containing protein